jgi:2-dehydropantoate 2-reductase
MVTNSSDIKSVCIFGTGGVGGYYGGKIAESINREATPGRAVYFIARGEHLQAIKSQGISVKTPGRTYSGIPTLATDDMHEVPSPDLILLCVKCYDLDAALEDIKCNMQDRTVILPLLNGIDIYERIRNKIKKGVVLPACVYLGTHIEKPGVIDQNGGNGIILTGPDPLFPLYSGKNIRNYLKFTGIDLTWNDDPRPAIWEKYLFIAAFGLVSAFAEKSLGAIMESDALRPMVRSIMAEILAIADKKAVNLPLEIIETSLNKAFNFPYEARTSYQRDIESKRRLNEGDLYGGTIIREGSSLGIPTPVTESIYRQINIKSPPL